MTSAEILDLLDRDLAAGIRAGANLRERRAKAASEGPWRWDPGYDDQIVGGPTRPHGGVNDVAETRQPEDAEHIAAEANPPHALAAVRRWRGVVERHAKCPGSDHPWCAQCDGEPWPCPDIRETADEVRAYLQAGAQ